ncbi:MAG: pyridoxamine 5'-phosphate oxidase family protein [Pseudolabrys sp.]
MLDKTKIDEAHLVTSVEQLEKLYGERMPTSILKEIDHIDDNYRKLIEASPFVAIATGGPEGLDCSPKGDAPGFVRVADEKTLMIPDRPGNNRTDGFHNIVRDPRIGLMFLIPGVGETMRVNGTAKLSVDPALCESFAVNGKPARAVLIVTVESAYFHCAKAIMRSKLWDPASQIDRKSLPSTGTIIAELSEGKYGGDSYDRELPERHKKQLY